MLTIITNAIDFNMEKVPMHEIFESIQGEGPFMGRRSLFIRFAGCNLANVCSSCDTDFTPKFYVSVDDIVKRIVDFGRDGGKVVVFTGGEPGLYANFIDKVVKEVMFTYPLRFTFQVETNGIIKMGSDFIVLGGVVVVSPKKGFEDFAVKNYAGKRYAHFKLVVGAENDDRFWNLQDGEEFIKKLINIHDKSNIWVMPFGADEETTSKNRKIVWDMALKYGINYTDRLHVLVWGKSMEGV